MEYIIFPVRSGDLFLCTKRAALNMAYQEFTEKFGKYEPLLTVTGKVSDFVYVYKNTIDEGVKPKAC